MYRLTLILALTATAADAANPAYEAACERVATAKKIEDAAFIPTCICAYGVIEAELGTAFTARYLSWETGQASLAEILPEGMTEDGFFEVIGSIPEEKWAACAP